eukprot:10366214-Alexandrium_andersonii.AAC.1
MRPRYERLPGAKRPLLRQEAAKLRDPRLGRAVETPRCTRCLRHEDLGSDLQPIQPRELFGPRLVGL